MLTGNPPAGAEVRSLYVSHGGLDRSTHQTRVVIPIHGELAKQPAMDQHVISDLVLIACPLVVDDAAAGHQPRWHGDVAAVCQHEAG
eukprot:COSAG01_NODE_1099_length_11701_cov_8.251508_5_plen_87_part_00